MNALSAESRRAFAKLAPMADVAAPICLAAAGGRFALATQLTVLCTVAGLPQARCADVQKCLELSETLGVFERTSSLSWRASDLKLATELAPLLLGVKIYVAEVHQDENMVDVVITRPPAPSQIAMKLDSLLSRSWKLLDTRSLLPAIAESSRKEFVVMTPFIDEVGAEIVLNLFHQAHVPTRCLILRAGPDGKAPPALAVIRPHLDALGVSVLNARLGKSEGRGRETFHAKVVLADDAAAYVGSSNMLRSSFTSSLELGLYVRGEAAKRVADVLRAVISVAPTMMN